MIKLRILCIRATNRRLAAGLTVYLTAMMLGLTSSGNAAADSLAKQATNPIADLALVSLIDQYNWDNYEVDDDSNAAILQGVVPFKLPFESAPLLITRTTLPVNVTTPDLGPGIGSRDGLGDLVFLGLVVPDLGIEGVTVGTGPTITAPTANDTFTGSGKWQAGPSGLVIVERIPEWQFGVFAYQQWSFAGESDRPGVSKLNLQPFVTKHFEGGWYAGTQDIPWTYNFKTDNWTMPMGLKGGRVMKIGNQPVNISVGVYHSPLNDGLSAKWTARFNVSLLFPEE